MNENVDKYPIVGVHIYHNRTWLQYSDGTVSGGVWWVSSEEAEAYCARVMPKERIFRVTVEEIAGGIKLGY